MRIKDLGLKKGKADFLEGPYNVKMAELVQAGFTPWSTEDVFTAYNKAFKTTPQDTTIYHWIYHQTFETDFGIVADKTTVYIDPHSQRLRKITFQTPLVCGGLALSEKARTQLQQYARESLTLSRLLTEE